MLKAAAYIDGLNLYHGMKAGNFKHLLWLDLAALCTALLPSDADLRDVHYYTAEVPHPADSRERQRTYIDALESCSPLTRTVRGFMQDEDRLCRRCNHVYIHRAEKRTGVNLAVDLVADAYDGRYQIALLVSGDADQVATVERATKRGVEVQVAFPPQRVSDQLKGVAAGWKVIGRRTLERNQLPPSVFNSRNHELRRPQEWSKVRSA